ncbi:MATE family efflux transporter [Endozoicomonas sp. 4G]|uniref:MATE family efflux transporter n=1 Tax=Endozoicomonas sp. 4G TaxID=2872754 RepID=UPI002078557C|nr:MATE family efflux transporter [Endozoicomonas sp. 4G]
MSQHQRLGQEPIDKLLLSMMMSASAGMLTIMLYNTVDTIFIGHFVGSQGIAAVTLAYPISLLLPTLGMAIGAGAGSLMSRKLGQGDVHNARHTYGNGFSLALVLCLLASTLAYLFTDPILTLFGANEETHELAKSYYHIALIGIPFLGSWMSMNQMLRAEGLARLSMNSMWLSSFLNIILDAIFIALLDMGLEGAALATVISQISGWVFSISIYLRKKSSMRLQTKFFSWQKSLIKEIVALSGIAFGRQVGDAILLIALNKFLLMYGGPLLIAAYGIINRLQTLMMVPIIGLNQSFIPIAGYNFGARRYDRVISAFIKSILYGLVFSYILVAIVWLAPEFFIGWFTTEADLINATLSGLKLIILCMPLVIFQTVGAAYFQAMGKPLAGLVMTSSRQLLLMTPLLFLLTPGLGLKGIWLSFPVANTIGAVLVILLFRYILAGLKNKHRALEQEEQLRGQADKTVN